MSQAAQTHPVLDPVLAPPFPQAALPVLRNPQLRKNVAHAIDVIQAKRARLVAEKTDWQAAALGGLGHPRPRPRKSRLLSRTVRGPLHRRRRHGPLGRGRRRGAPDHPRSAAPGERHRSHQDQDHDLGRDSVESLPRSRGHQRLRDRPGRDHSPTRRRRALAHRRSRAARQSQPGARNLCPPHGTRKISPTIPQALTAAARTYLRQKFLTIPTAISGANFLIAETGSVAVVESEGNGRMCLTLPRTMITLAGIEKVLAALSGSRSHAAGAGALGHRRAHESLHLALDRRHARRRPAALPRGAARQRPLVNSRPAHASARPSSASAAPPA